MSQKLLFGGVFLLMTHTHLLHTHLFSDMHKETEMYKSIRHLCPYIIGTSYAYGIKLGTGKRETAWTIVYLKWTDSPSHKCLMYWVQVYVSSHERGRVKKPSSRASLLSDVNHKCII